MTDEEAYDIYTKAVPKLREYIRENMRMKEVARIFKKLGIGDMTVGEFLERFEEENEVS